MDVISCLLFGIVMSTFQPVTSRSFRWRRVPSMDEKIVAGSFLTFPYMDYKTFCAQLCSQKINCYSFFFNKLTFSCSLHDNVYTHLTPSTFSASTRYFISSDREITTTEAPTTTPTTVTTTTTVLTPICPNNYIDNGGYCFKVSSSTESWSTARSLCQSVTGGDLLVIDNPTKQNYFNNYLKLNNFLNSYHFGVHHIYANGDFVLVDGRNQDSATFSYWAANEPNNLNGPNLCGFLEWNTGQTEIRWNDGSCSYSDYYICEVKI